MGLVHAGFTFVGTAGPFDWGRWDTPVQRTKVAGVEGVAVLDLKRGSRDFSVDVWIHNDFASEAALRSYLGTIEEHANVTGTLTRSGVINSSIANVRFDSMDLDRECVPSANLGWFAIARLNFEQLSP